MSIPAGTAKRRLARRDRAFCLALGFVLVLLYAICQNGQWVPGGGDGAYYLAIARNIATGQGYHWNGMPVVMVPPGWPAVLAGLMRVSGSFAFLGVALVAFCVGAACAWYYVLRRLTTPLRAIITVAVAATLFEWHRFTFTFYSESLFFLLCALAVLLAMQVNEGRPGAWRIAALVLLSGGMVAVRWSGLLMVALVAAVLVGGRLRPVLSRKRLAIVLVVAVSAGTFVVTRWALQSCASRSIAAEHDEGTRARMTTALSVGARQVDLALGAGRVGYVGRLVNAGHLLTTLFWPPTIVGNSGRVQSALLDALGWALFLLIAAHLRRAARRGEWIWLGLLVLCAALVVIRNRPVARYLAPVGPLVLLGIWEAISPSRDAHGRTSGRWAPRRLAATVLLGSIGLCNLAIFAVNAYVARSPDFVQICLAGEYRDALSIAEFLRPEPSRDAKVAAFAKYRDPIRTRRSTWIQRVLVLLADREILDAKVARRRGKTSKDDIRRWASERQVSYIVMRPSKIGSRLWHLRLPLSIGEPAEKDAPWYVLYEIGGEDMALVDLPDVTEGLRRVPGL